MTARSVNEAAWIAAAGRVFEVIRYASATKVTDEQLWMIHDLADALHNIDMAGHDADVFDRYHAPDRLEPVQRLIQQLNDSLRDPMSRRQRPVGARRGTASRQLRETRTP